MNTRQSFTPVNHLIGPRASKEHEVNQKGGLGGKELVMEELVESRPAKEVSRFVRSHEETPAVSADLQRYGMTAPESVPTFAAPSPAIRLPISDAKIIEGLCAPTTSSFRWLAEWAYYILKKAHLTVKKIHGQVRRVVER